MKTILLLSLSLSLPAATALAQAPTSSQADLQAAFDSLIAAEKAFSRTSVEKGTREAFLTFMADDGLVFEPGPVNGKKQWEPRPANAPAILIWRPIHSDIAVSGDLGYNTGPYEIRPNDPSRPKAYGHFMSIWKKQADGTWKVAVDMGNRHPAPTGSEPTVDGPETPIRLSGAKPASGKAGVPEVAEVAGLLEEDRAFGKEVAARGTEAAYLARLAAEPRLYRDGKYPQVGLEAARKALAGAPPLSTKPLGGDISRAGDFGYTYGEYQERAAGSGEAGHYTRIWRRQGGDWKLLLEVLNALPPPPPAKP